MSAVRLLSTFLLCLPTFVIAQSGQYGQNIKNYGAIGNGNSNPASSQFSTLANCQATYPTCAALTDEIDTLAFEKAEAATLSQSAANDVVVVPAGVYVLNRTIKIPIDTNTTIPAGNAFGILGVGSNGTIFQPDAAMLATGAPLMACGNGTSDTPTNGQGRYSVEGGCSGSYTGFTLRSAASFSAAQYSENPPTVGGTAVTSDGRMHLTDVAVEGFVHGFNVVGDHEVWNRIYSRYNQDGIYMAPESQYLFGDLTWISPGLSANTRSGIFVSKDAYLSASISGQLYSSGSPYAILGEAGAPDSYVGASALPILLNTSSTDTLSEFLSNGFIVDANTFSGGTAIRDIVMTTLNQTEVIGCGSSPPPGCATYTVGGQSNSAWINVHIISGLKLSLQAFSFLPQTGMLAGFEVRDIGPALTGNFGGLDFEINPDLVTSSTPPSYASMNLPLFSGFAAGVNDNSCQNVHITTRGEWTGTCIIIPVGGTYHSALASLAPGTVLRRYFEAMGVGDGTYDPVMAAAGVNMQPWTTSAVNSGTAVTTTIIATSGVVSNVPYTTVPSSAGIIMKAVGPASVTPCTTTTALCPDGFQVGQVTAWDTGTSTATLRLVLGY